MITEAAFQESAISLGCDLAAIKAVAEVESRGDGFIKDKTGARVPKTLFERHVFSRLTGGKYDAIAPDISNPISSAKDRSYGTYAEQPARLEKAAKLDRNAALQSASWGIFQIMGFNYQLAGFKTLQDFVNAMYKDEDEHLKAFVNFVKNSDLASALKNHDWAAFARGYNGADYRQSQYDTKLAQAYAKYAKE